MTAAFAYDRGDVYDALEKMRLDLKGIRVLLNRALDLIPDDPSRAKAENFSKMGKRILRVVADYYGMIPDALLQDTNAYHVARPRHVAMYLLRELTGCSYPQAGRQFGRFHHTTVMHGCMEIKRRRAKDPAFDKVVESLMNKVVKQS